MVGYRINLKVKISTSSLAKVFYLFNSLVAYASFMLSGYMLAKNSNYTYILLVVAIIALISSILCRKSIVTHKNTYILRAYFDTEVSLSNTAIIDEVMSCRVKPLSESIDTSNLVYKDIALDKKMKEQLSVFLQSAKIESVEKVTELL
jgi:hypothetical protein